MLGFFLVTIVVSTVVKMDVIIHFMDIALGLMTIYIILSSNLLAPKENQAAREYFEKLKKISKMRAVKNKYIEYV